MLNLSSIGADWLCDRASCIVEGVAHVSPVDFNESVRYLPDSVTPMPGFISFDINPYMRELVEACDPRSSVREVNLRKGVQITYSTMLESVLLYYMAYIKTRPCMLVSADRELVKGRVDNYILPMLSQSDLSSIIMSSDEGNARKTGKTANNLQWNGGGFLVLGGANNADKMRMWSIQLMLKDEIDAWPDVVGKDGDPDLLTDDRCSAFWAVRKIYRGGTPLMKGKSKIQYQYERGDQRKYHVLCKSCSYPQELVWNFINKETGTVGGFLWDTDDGVLILESVRYACINCSHEHYEHDKTVLFSSDHGAEWVPTAKPVEPGIRSYHLPAFYSPVGFQPWYKCVSSYLKGFDEKQGRVKDLTKYQVFYNNILARPFEVRGSKVSFSYVSGHRRKFYLYGEVPNSYVEKYSGSKILFLTCQVDVHKRSLSVAVMGWARDARCYLIDYFTIDIADSEDEDSIDCTQSNSKAWTSLSEQLESKVYYDESGIAYKPVITLIDSGYANDTVTTFCSKYSQGVYPILGRDRPAKNQVISEFAEFRTKVGTVGYRILVDHYKDRISSLLRRKWDEDMGVQSPYHFNAPMNCTDDQLKELTVEYRAEKKDLRGMTVYEWFRPSGSKNELFDLLVYGYCAVDILAWSICIEHFALENVVWDQFWDYVAMPDNDNKFGRLNGVDRL